jgi:hypothetical protein
MTLPCPESRLYWICKIYLDWLLVKFLFTLTTCLIRSPLSNMFSITLSFLQPMESRSSLSLYFHIKRNTRWKWYLSLTYKTSLGTFQIYYCLCRQKNTSNFLSFLKSRPLPPRFITTIFDEKNESNPNSSICDVCTKDYFPYTVQSLSSSWSCRESLIVIWAPWK